MPQFPLRSMVSKKNVACLFFMCVCTSIAQFGQNKVQYTPLSWQFYNTKHVNLYFHQDQNDLPEITSFWINHLYEKLSDKFNFTHSSSLPMIIFGNPILFEQTNVIPDIIPEGVGGFTEQMKNRVVVPFTGSYDEFYHVIFHELIHAFQYGILFDEIGNSLIQPSAAQLPLWFAEGSAEFLSSGWNNESDMYLMDRTVFGSVPLPGPEMNDYMVYKGGQSFLFFLQSSRGDSAFNSFLFSFRKSRQLVESLEKTYRQSLQDLGEEWLQQLKRIYWPEMGKRELLSKKATPLTNHSKDHSFFNLNPALSPDGSKIAFYSDRHDYTKIFICDTTGKLLHTVGQYGFSGYFESFEPFRSGLCWSPDGKFLAFISKNHGKNQIRIFDLKKKKTTRILTPQLETISAPDWSHDGNFITFSGLKKAQLDIYTIDIRTEKLTQLTNDKRAKSHPHFSPSGSTILYDASDTLMINQRLTSLKKTNTHLFLLDLASGKSKQLTGNTNTIDCNESQPCFSPNGNQIAYICDENGINNIYIMNLDSLDQGKPLTNVIGGCSSPHWSKEKNTIAFCQFQKQGWDIWMIDDPLKKIIDKPLASTFWVESCLDTSIHFFEKASIPDSASSAKLLAYYKRMSNKTGAPLTNDSLKQIPQPVEEPIALQPQTPSDKSEKSDVQAKTQSKKDTEKLTDTFSTFSANLEPKSYKTKFTLDQVSAGMAVSNQIGNFAGQGVIVLSDLLGNKQIAIAGNIQGQADQNNVFVAYMDYGRKIDYGVAGFFQQYYTFNSKIGEIDKRYNETIFGTQITFSNPFSMFNRTDLDIYYSYLSRKAFVYKEATGKWNRVDSLDPKPLNIFLPSLSYVFDNILMGITGPMNGFRGLAKLAIAPKLSAADPSYASFDTDLRLYWHAMRKLVFAARITNGFSLSLNTDPSARRYYLGGNDNWLFYDLNETIYDSALDNLIYAAIVGPMRGWDYFDISGTRYAVANLELRFPFINQIDLSWPLPLTIQYINGALFMDAGNAWDKKDEHKNIPLPHKIYGGIGFGWRLNIGIAVVKHDIAWKTNYRRILGNAKHYLSLGAEF